MATVTLVGISKQFGSQSILHDIYLNIEKGEFVAVVGPSGCGKSTLLRLVAGLDSPSQGNILINDKCVNKIPPAARDMAMVFQSYALYPHMTVYDNMAYGLKMRGMQKNLIRQRVEEAADLLQLRDYLQRKPAMLSGGQCQRVAMGRAIVRSPAVFLFDEPLSNLDAKLRTEMRHEIKKLHRQLKTTCIYVTHDQTEAMTLADRVVVLNKGSIEQVGTPGELYQNPATLFVASFIGHYPMNFLQASADVQKGVLKTQIGIELPLPKLNHPISSGEPLMIGIRPEHMSVVPSGKPEAIPVAIEFIDDMGADKLLQVITACGNERLTVRVAADTPLAAEQLSVTMEMSKVSLFCQKTGKRLG